MAEKIKRGSGNVFKDLGFDNPEEYQVKANLALQIIKIIEKRDLTQNQAATLIGAKQPDISKLVRRQDILDTGRKKLRCASGSFG